MIERYRNPEELSPEILKSRLEISYSGSSQPSTVVDMLKAGHSVALIVKDTTSIIFGHSRMHSPLEQELGINEHNDHYIKAAAYLPKDTSESRVRFDDTTPKKVALMYGAEGDQAYDYSSVIEMKVREYLDNLIKEKRKKKK